MVVRAPKPFQRRRLHGRFGELRRHELSPTGIMARTRFATSRVTRRRERLEHDVAVLGTIAVPSRRARTRAPRCRPSRSSSRWTAQRSRRPEDGPRRIGTIPLSGERRRFGFELPGGHQTVEGSLCHRGVASAVSSPRRHLRTTDKRWSASVRDPAAPRSRAVLFRSRSVLCQSKGNA